MRVQEVILNDNKKRYLLLDEVGVPVVPVMKYLKHLDQTGKSNNTLKTYCYALKQYFTYLEERKIDYKEVGVKDLPDFVGCCVIRLKAEKLLHYNRLKRKELLANSSSS